MARTVSWTQSKRSAVIDGILSAVRSGQMKPGDRLPSERELAERFGAGRNAVREALAALRVAGLVESRPGDGHFVRPIQGLDGLRAQVLNLLEISDNPFDALEARSILEPAIARLAVSRAEPNDLSAMLDALDQMHEAAETNHSERYLQSEAAFHLSLARMTHNSFLVRVMESLVSMMADTLWRRTLVVDGKRLMAWYGVHREIYEAFARQDAAAAEAALHLHFEMASREFGG
jgi:DNA-binding FadR family transcriptional regulator